MLAWHISPDYPLVIAANRDEFFDRPTAPASFWEEQPNVLAGRDLHGGGTWMGITRNLRFAALTNVRESRETFNTDAPSRGKLVSEFLSARRRPDTYSKAVARQGNQYNGFNLLVADRDMLYYICNRGGAIKELKAGIYGLSNHQLDTPWPKLEQARERFSDAIEHLPDFESIFELLGDTTPAPDADLPDTGVSVDWERTLSSIFVKSPTYGTRSSTIIAVRADNSVRFIERRYGPGGAPAGGTDVAFMAEV
jgi:uncharacterized protein with NRDE domain